MYYFKDEKYFCPFIYFLDNMFLFNYFILLLKISAIHCERSFFFPIQNLLAFSYLISCLQYIAHFLLILIKMKKRM